MIAAESTHLDASGALSPSGAEAGTQAAASASVTLDDYHRHEALDRCHVINSMLCDYLLEHPFIAQNEWLRQRVGDAVSILGDVYQAIGLNADVEAADQNAGEAAERGKPEPNPAQTRQPEGGK